MRNLKEISPTAYLTVPKGWEELVNALEQDAELRERFFSRMKLFFFAAAGLSQSIWDRLDRVAEQHCGERIRMMAGLGMTEAAPSCTFTTGPLSMAGYIACPRRGARCVWCRWTANWKGAFAARTSCPATGVRRSKPPRCSTRTAFTVPVMRSSWQTLRHRSLA
ncbi:hypothetical protein PSA5_00585 [Pseudomonas syringae pv. actinidiae]|nr:hypothetical protein PSA5_00585 [Pseudomonas syringae pv. actinidiae]